MTAITLANSLKCTSFDGETEVTSSLNKFFNKISEGLGDAFEFVDELDEVVSDISDSMEGLTTAMTDFLEESVVGFISEGMQAAKNFLLNKFSLPFVGLAQNKAFENAMFAPLNGLFSAFGCLGSTIKKAMKNTVKNMLLNMIKGGFVNPVGCAIQDFIGGLTGKITNMVSGIIEPLMAPINNMLGIVGKAFGPIKGFLLGGLNILGKIQGLINCADNDSSAECHVQETYDLFTGVGSKKDDADKQNSFSKGLDDFADRINQAGDSLDGLTSDIGYWGIFGGQKMTKERKIKQLEKRLEEIREGRVDNTEEITKLNNEIVLLESQLNDTAYLNSILPDNGRYRIGDYYKDDPNILPGLNWMVLKFDGSFKKVKGSETDRPQFGSEHGRTSLEYVAGKLKEFRKNQLRRVDELKKEISDLQEIPDEEKLLKELEEARNKPDGYVYEDETKVGKNKDGVPWLSEVELDCNTGNVFKCGLPKVKIFGGNGEGAVGDIILGNFIEELDREISGTKYTQTAPGLQPLDAEIISVKRKLDALASKTTNLKALIERLKRDGRGNGLIPVYEQEVKDNEAEINKLKSKLENLEEKREELVPGGGNGSTDVEIGGSIVQDIKSTASIIGVDIKYPGEGYTKEPIVRFEDNCKQGYGAFGKAIIDKDPNSPSFGQLIDVLIVSQGENYPADAPEDVYVKRIVVEDGGSGYKMDDKVGDFEICGLGENGQITKVCTNDRAYRSIPSTTVQSETGSGAILTPIMTRRPRPMEVITVIDCITPRGNIVGYVNGKEYNGPFHVHPETGEKMVGIAHTTRAHATIYDTPQESLRGGTPSSNVGSTQIRTRTISELITESETQSQIDDTPPSSPPSSTPPSSPPSSGGGGY